MIASIKRNIIAYTALFVALGGTGYAASSLPRNSVGSAQLQNGAVTNAKVRSGSLSASAFKPGTLPGNPTLTTTVVYGAANPPSCTGTSCPTVPAGTSNAETAQCPSGDRAVNGGYALAPGGAADEVVTGSMPTSNGDGWIVTFTLTQAGATPVGEVAAVCASLS